MKKLFFVLMFGFVTMLSNAQTAPLKIGYADVEYIFSQMPEAKQIENELQTLQTQLKKQYDTKVAEFQKKYQEYQQFGANVSEAIRQNSERELQQMEQNLQKLQQDSQTEMQKKNTALLEPVQAKVGKAIEDVAKENGFSFILNPGLSGADFILYGDEKLDVSDLVLKKMGITPVAPAPAPTTPTTTPKK